MSKIAYAKHPIELTDIESLVSDGYKIIDIKFMPDDIGKEDIVFPKPKKERVKKKQD